MKYIYERFGNFREKITCNYRGDGSQPQSIILTLSPAGAAPAKIYRPRLGGALPQLIYLTPPFARHGRCIFLTTPPRVVFYCDDYSKCPTFYPKCPLLILVCPRFGFRHSR